MNARQVLSKIASLLSIEEKVEFVDAKAKNGAILQSPTFDVGEKVEVVQEDGSKIPAPDGEHEIALKDSEGNEVLIKIETEGGIITERENVELPEAEAKAEEAEMGYEGEDSDKAVKGLEMKAEIAEAHPLPQTTDEDVRNMITEDDEATEEEPLISLSYRITELENKMKDLMEKFEKEAPKSEKEPKVEEVEMEEVDVPKLDGAPIEETTQKFSANKIKTNKEKDYQSSFLSKLYK